MHVVHCGVDTTNFAPVKVGTGPLVAVGRLVPKKGFDLLVRAMAGLRDMGIDLPCLIIGDGTQRHELESLVAELDVADRVKFAGARTSAEVREALSDATAFVLPCIEAPGGDMDGIPVSLMEAMSMQKVVVTSDISGIRELVTDGDNGLLLPPGDVPALVALLARLARGEVDVESLGRSARATVEADFHSRKNARSLRSLISNCTRTEEAR